MGSHPGSSGWAASAAQDSGRLAQLNVLYRLVHGCVYEEQLSNPAGNATGLAQLLSFADAVGSSGGMLHALDADATCLTAKVQLAGQQALTLELDLGDSYSFSHAQLDVWMHLRHVAELGGSEDELCAALSSSAGQASIKQQFASQIEALLHLAYKLQLPLLKKSLHTVILCNSYQQGPMLDVNAMDTITSQRVLAACDQQTSKAALINDLTTQLLVAGNSSYKWHCLMQPRTMPFMVMEDKVLVWDTHLGEDFLCYRKGETLEVFMQLFPSHDQSPRVCVKPLGAGDLQLRELNIELRVVPWGSSSTGAHQGA